MNPKAHETLRRAKALIQDKSRWCQRDYAKTANGANVLSASPEAFSFCAMGAVYRVDGKTYTSADDALHSASWCLYGAPPSGVNDDLGHAAVMKMYSAALWGCGT